MMPRSGLLSTPERIATLLSVAMIPAIVAMIVTLTNPLATPTGVAVATPSGSAPLATASGPPASTAASPTLPPGPILRLIAANAAVLEDGDSLQSTLKANGTGSELVSDLRRLNESTRLALDAAQAVTGTSPGARIAKDLASAYGAMRQRIAEGLAVTVSNTAAYRRTAQDVISQMKVISTLDAQLQALGSS